MNPALRGKPVIVCVYSGRTEESGVVSTCNYEARKYGVKAGTPITHARRLLGTVDASFLPTNRSHYAEVSDRVMATLETFADTFEKAGIDEAYLDITSGTKGDVNRAQSIAREIKQKVFEQEEITCSVGVAPNKLLAKIASDLNKPNGLTVIRPENVRSFLGELSVYRIPGVGKKTEEKLDQLKVKTISQLATLDFSVLHEIFGSALGSYLYKAARGEDDEPVEDREQPSQLSRIATLKRNTRDISEILPLLEDLANSATAKLAEKAMTCKTVSVVAILSDLSIHSKSRTLESPTFDMRTIAQASKDLFGQFLQAEPTATVRRVGVKLSGLSGRSGQTDISKFLS
jgi:DNA polymerase IV (DinB-like DNA polymerase)